MTAVSIRTNHCSLCRLASAGIPASVIRVFEDRERQFRKLADLLEARVANVGSLQEQADQSPQRTDVLDSRVGHLRRIENGQRSQMAEAGQVLHPVVVQIAVDETCRFQAEALADQSIALVAQGFVRAVDRRDTAPAATRTIIAPMPSASRRRLALRRRAATVANGRTGRRPNRVRQASAQPNHGEDQEQNDEHNDADDTTHE